MEITQKSLYTNFTGTCARLSWVAMVTQAARFIGATRVVCTALLSLLFICQSYASEYQPALVYQGTASATGDPEAIVDILDQHGATHQLATSEDLNIMTLDDFSKYGVIIWPGGYAGFMSESLLPSTRALINRAVTERGISFVGFCAGAFIAVSPAALPGSEGPAWGFSLIPGDLLPYYHLEDEGVEYAMVQVQLADKSARSLLWWGGPSLPEFPHGVIARYSDTGEPAIAQTWAGKGLVLLSGPHPESPQEWRTKLGLTDSDGLEQDIAWAMFHAALTHQPMPTLNAEKIHSV